MNFVFNASKCFIIITVSLKETGWLTNSQEIYLRISNIIFLAINYYSIKENPNVLVLKFEHFSNLYLYTKLFILRRPL